MAKQPDMSQITRLAERQGVSLYLQLSNVFRSRIESGEWPVGERIPTVEALYKSYGVAGMTIRQALGILEEEGLIERFRAKGTFVRAKPHRDPWCDVKTDLSGFMMDRPDAILEVLEDKILNNLPAALQDEGTDGTKYRYLRRIHTRDEVKFLLSNAYIIQEIGVQIPQEDLATKSAIRMVTDASGVQVADAKQVLTIEHADLETAQALDIPLDAPVAKLVRVAYDDAARALLISHNIYRSDTVRIEMRLA